MCSVCMDVLNDPVMTGCLHIFCRSCLQECLQVRETCPMDQSKVVPSRVLQAPSNLRYMLDKLHLRCPFTAHGCRQGCTRYEMENHRSVCEYNPELVIICEECELPVTGLERKTHNCVRELKVLIKKKEESHKRKVASFEKKISQMKKDHEKQLVAASKAVVSQAVRGPTKPVEGSRVTKKGHRRSGVARRSTRRRRSGKSRGKNNSGHRRSKGSRTTASKKRHSTSKKGKSSRRSKTHFRRGRY